MVGFLANHVAAPGVVPLIPSSLIHFDVRQSVEAAGEQVPARVLLFVA
jgi:hypothetical protein